MRKRRSALTVSDAEIIRVFLIIIRKEGNRNDEHAESSALNNWVRENVKRNMKSIEN